MMAKSWWLTPVILATWEVETGRITVGNQTVWGGTSSQQEKLDVVAVPIMPASGRAPA
jgi:hypothetical protein